MLYGRWDITVHKGKTWKMAFNAKTKDGLTRHFDGYDDIILTVKQAWTNTAVEDSTPLLVLSKAAGDFTITNAGADINVYMSPTKTGALSFSEGRYEMDLHLGADIEPFLAGKMSLIGPED